VLLDGALTAGFDETRPLLYGLAWLVALACLVTVTHRYAISAAGNRRLPRPLSTHTERRPS